MALVVVESFAKVPKLQKILPKNYEIMASGGHIMDLDPNNMSIDLDTFEPTYVYYSKSKAIISKIRKAYKSGKRLIIASDLDREGEFIGESLRNLV
jgi:DNA topoisomerase-1